MPRNPGLKDGIPLGFPEVVDVYDNGRIHTLRKRTRLPCAAVMERAALAVLEVWLWHPPLRDSNPPYTPDERKHWRRRCW